MTFRTSDDSYFSRLEQRLQYADLFPSRSFMTLVDNVPKWPGGLPVSAIELGSCARYESCFGIPELRSGIALAESRRFNTTVEVDNVLITPGAMQAACLVFRRLRKRGNTFVCQAPVFGMMPKLLRRCGFKVLLLNTIDGSFNERELGEIPWADVAGVYLHSPANPTGEILSQETLSAIIERTRQHKTSIVFDGVYDRFILDGGSPISPHQLTADWDNLYIINSFSKGFGAPGIRVGWIVSSRKTIEQLAGTVEQELVSVSGWCQEFAARLLEQGQAPLLQAVQRDLNQVLAMAGDSELIEISPVCGGTQVLAKLDVDHDDTFADWALREKGLVVVTSSHFEGCSQSNVVRFPLGGPLGFAERAFRALTEAVTDYNAAQSRMVNQATPASVTPQHQLVVEQGY